MPLASGDELPSDRRSIRRVPHVALAAAPTVFVEGASWEVTRGNSGLSSCCSAAAWSFAFEGFSEMTERPQKKAPKGREGLRPPVGVTHVPLAAVDGGCGVGVDGFLALDRMGADFPREPFELSIGFLKLLEHELLGRGGAELSEQSNPGVLATFLDGVSRTIGKEVFPIPDEAPGHISAVFLILPQAVPEAERREWFGDPVDDFYFCSHTRPGRAVSHDRFLPVGSTSREASRNQRARFWREKRNDPADENGNKNMTFHHQTRPERRWRQCRRENQ